MAKALNLKYINADSIYKASQLQIFNDTAVGHYSDGSFNPGFYFIQCLKRPGSVKIIKRNIVEYKNEASCPTCTMTAEQLKNGCLYFPKFGGNTLIKLCNDTSAKEYLKKYNDSLFYANRTLFYKGMVIVSSCNGIYIFDLNTEKLLWKQKYALNYGIIGIIGQKLVYTWKIEPDETKPTSFITCIDLENFRLCWQKTFPNDLIYNEMPRDVSYFNKIVVNGTQQIAVPTFHKFLVIDVNSGVIRLNVRSEDNHSFSPGFVLDNDFLYLNYKDTTNCFDLNNKRLIWQLPKYYLEGEYKSFLIGTSADEKYYELISKETGKIVKKIPNPNLLENSIRFIDRYVLINDRDLYE